MDVMNTILSRSGRGYFGCGHLFPTNEFVGYLHFVPNGTDLNEGVQKNIAERWNANTLNAFSPMTFYCTGGYSNCGYSNDSYDKLFHIFFFIFC